MNTKFERFKKMAMEELGLKIKPSDEKLSFKTLFGINIEDFKYLEAGDEIRLSLETHPEIEQYTIIDDEDDMLEE